MRAVTLVLLLGVIAVSAKLVKREVLKYNVIGRSFASLNSVKDEWSGAIYNATLEYVSDKGVNFGKLSDLKFIEVQGPINKDWIPAKNAEWISIPLTDSGFKIISENEKISKIQIDYETPQWEVNVIRSVVNLFQHSEPKRRSTPGERFATYIVEETAIDGICNTLYYLQPVPEDQKWDVPKEIQTPRNQWIQYIKSTNFSNCEKLPVYQIGLPNRPLQKRVGINRLGEFFSRSNAAKMVKDGQNGHILFSETTNTVVVSPEIYNIQKGNALTQMKMVLKSVKIEYRIEIEMSSSKNWVTYSLVNDLTGEPFQESSESPKVPSIKDAPWNPTNFYFSDEAEQNIDYVLKELADVKPENVGSKEELESFMLLTTVVRTVGYNQLFDVVGKYFKAKSSNTQSSVAWTYLRDSIAQAGTGPTFLIVKDLIESKKVTGEEAVQLIAAQSKAVHEPSAELIKTFFDLVKSKVVEENFQLLSATSSAFTHLVRKYIIAPVQEQKRYKAPRDIRFLEETYVPYFADKLRQAVTEQNGPKVQLFIYALGNIAHPSIIQVFEPYLDGTVPLTTFQRTLIVISLQKLGKFSPSTTLPILFNLYSNEFEPYQVRVAAVYTLIKMNPPVDILQRMATMSNVEKNQQVRAAVKTAIESAARLTGEWNLKRRQNARAAVNLLPANPPGLQYSRQHLVDYVFGEMSMSVESELSYIGSDDDLSPQAWFLRASEYYNELFTTGFSLSAMVSSVKDLRDFLSESYEEEPVDPHIAEKMKKLMEMLQELNISKTPTKELEGNLQWAFAGAERFFAFNSTNVLDAMKRSYIALARKFEINYQTRVIQHETVWAFPSVLGFPFVYSFAQPSVFSVVGNFQASFGVDSSSVNNVTIQPDLQVVYASQNQGRLQFVSYNNRSFIAGNERSFRLATPFTSEINIDFNNQTVKVQVNATNLKEQEIFSYSAKPFTGIINATKPDHIDSWPKFKPLVIREARKIEWADTYQGITVHVQGETEKENFQLYDTVVPSLSFALPIAEKTIEPTSIRIIVKPEKVQSYVFMASYERESQEQFSLKMASKSPSQLFSGATKSNNDDVVHVFNLSFDAIADKISRYSLYVIMKDSPTQPWMCAGLNVQDQESVLCVAADMPEVSEYNFKKSLEEQADGEVQIILLHGGNSNHCEAKVVLKRTENRLEHVRKQPQALQCFSEMTQGNFFHYACRNATFHAGLFDRYEIDVKYPGLSDKVKGKLADWFDVARHWGYSYLSQNVTKKIQESNYLNATVQYNPSLKKFDLSLETTDGDFKFRQMPVPAVARSIAVVHPQISMADRVGFGAFRQQWKPTCSIDDQMMNTFDNCTHKYTPSQNTWGVIALSEPEKFQSKLDNFIVLHQLDEAGNRKISATFGGRKYLHTVDITPEYFGITVALNQEKLSLNEGERRQVLENGRLILEIVKINEEQYLISSPSVDIAHLVTRIVLTLKQQIRTHGLCGDNNHEPHDMISPQGKMVTNPDEFVASWSLNPERPTMKLRQLALEHGIDRPNYFHKNSNNDWGASKEQSSPEASSEGSNVVTHALHKRLMVIDFEGKQCFSTDVQSACKIGKPAIKTVKKQVQFVCVEKNATSMHWAKLIQHGARPDFRKKGKEEPIDVLVPTRCSL